jgi:integrase
VSDLARPAAALEVAIGEAREYAAHSRAESTTRAYAGDWGRFVVWCEASGETPLPARPLVIASYLAHLAGEGLSVSTLSRALVAIGQAHLLAGYESPRKSAEVREVLRGIQRTHGTAQKSKRPLVLAELSRVCHGLPDWTISVRDRALLLIGFAGAFRRSELVSLDVSDLELEDRGYVAHLRRSKTDQLAHGRDVAIPYGSDPLTCPVRALEAWLEMACIDAGAIFRQVDRHGRIGGRLSPASVASIVKRYAAAAGVDPRELSGHSLRSGLATSAAAAGKSERAIMAQTGHRSYQMVRRYIHRASLFDECGAVGIGL